ncbi:ATP-binding protein [Noviherbaspirillum denitrificans]|uniref:hybrid sensor histidine kinase/response regulator n=1 Tax=Noviherbaspirillum denitrificans TaxID=1968433 RepID=UPI001131EDE5|nr:ATP-binding protein [Noviherbaspirillum denitrificans]
MYDRADRMDMTVPDPETLDPVGGGQTEGDPFQTVWETDHRGMNHYQSPSWYRYVGEGFGSSFGEDWLRFYHPADREHLLAEWRKSLSSEGAHPYDIEVRIRRHDGVYRWFRVQGTPHRSRDGSVVKWAGTCTDIHAEKLARLAASPECGASETGRQPRRKEGLLVRLRQCLRIGPLELRLFVIVLAGILPLAVLAFATLFHNAEVQRQELIEANKGTMRAIITAVDSELATSIAALDALAASPRLQADDFEGFHREAREMLARRSGWRNVVLADPSARQLVNAHLPYGVSLPGRVDAAGLEDAVRSGKPGVGNIILSPVLKEYALSVRVPIVRDGAVRFVLTAVIHPETIRTILSRQRVPIEGVVAIFDKSYNIVARTIGQEDWVGKKPSPGLLALLEKGGQGGVAETRTLEGRPVYSVFARSPDSGWSAAVGISVEAIEAPIRRSYAALGGAILLSLLLGFLAAYLLSRTVTRPLKDLAQAAVAVGQGELPPVPRSDLPEVREVATALSAAYIEREKLLQGERDARLLEQEARVQAEKANKAKDEFLAMLGHELRNPLAAITTASEILDLMDQAPSRNKDTAGEARAIIRRQVRHLSRLTDDLLDAGRVILGKIKLERKVLDFSAIVRAAIETLQNTGRTGGIDMTSQLQQVWVEGDTTRLDQVVANLLANAVKYTPEPGSVCVTLEAQDGEAILRVRDSGLGLEADLLPRVFDLFVQGKRSLDRSQGGLGIGLTLVRRLVELHGGQVEARSDGPDRGSEFIVRLPAVAAPGLEPEAMTDVAARVSRTIVIVEDNRDVRVGLRAALELDGHRVVEAADGPAGIDTVLQAKADIALIDIGLPQLDGYGVARALRGRATHDIRLIAMTGYGSKENINRGKLAGFDAYLVKPVDMRVLHDLITGN